MSDSTDSDRFRTTTLTVLGAIGYLTFLVFALFKIRGFPVSWELLGIILLSSSAMLGIDPGIEIFGPVVRSTGNGGDTNTNDHDSHEERDN